MTLKRREAKKVRNIDRPLTVKIEDNQLVIRVGINTLVYCTEHCPIFYDYEKDAKTPGYGLGPYVKVKNKKELVKDVIGEILHEKEDGSTPLSDMLDNAILAAYEDGSLGFAEESYE